MASEVHLYRGEGSVRRDVVRVEVHRSVTAIPDNLFKYCNLLQSLLLHDGLLKIGGRAFQFCLSLRSFRCPSTVTEIGEGAFHGCFNLATVELPEGLESIENETFHGCTRLEAARIPAAVARIGNYAFHGCANLASVESSEGPRRIGHCAFWGCPSLENFRVPSSVVEIGRGAFMNCRNLSSVRLHEDLGRIGSFAFRGCASPSFRFVRLSERMEVVALDERTASAFEGRLNQIANAMVGEEDDPWEDCKQSLVRAHEVLTYWELKDATATLELALWRGEIEEEGGEQAAVIGDDQRTWDLGDASERNIDRPSRQECRVKCGADLVIAEVLKFFSYSTTWS